MMNLGSRILVAEDDSILRAVVVEVLHDAGYLDILEAGDGRTACRLLTEPDHIHLIVTDVNMPGAGGIEVAKWAKVHHPDAKLIFMTARPDQLDNLPFPYRFLKKPFSIDQLVDLVEKTGTFSGAAAPGAGGR
jgi:CheY-like chemotaxis protein